MNSRATVRDLRDQNSTDAADEAMWSSAAMQAIRAASLAITVSRVAIWLVLARSAVPLPVAEIRRQLIDRGRNVTLPSVYTMLRRLNEVGLVSGHVFDDGKMYFGLANFSVRNRLTCVDTGEERWLDDAQLAYSIAQLCRSHGFEMRNYTLSIQGRRVTALDVPTSPTLP